MARLSYGINMRQRSTLMKVDIAVNQYWVSKHLHKVLFVHLSACIGKVHLLPLVLQVSLSSKTILTVGKLSGLLVGNS